MKLNQLDLIAFGPFDDVSLDLRSGKPGLHVIYGDNEDGKSTMLRAIRGLLFGIEVRTKDDHVFKKAQLRIGGCLCHTNGDELAFVRRKGSKDTLRDPESDAPLPDAVLEPFIGGLSEKLFATLYGIDYQKLVSGGEEILEQKGDLAKTLYSAASGTASLKKVLDRMTQEADQLFKLRASKSRIYTGIGEYAAKLKESKEAMLLSSAWTKLRRERDEVEGARRDLEEETRQLRRDLAQRQRVRRVRPNLAQLDELQANLDQYGEVVDLPENFEQNRREAAELRRSAEERIKQITEKVQRLEDETSAARLPVEILEHASTIKLMNRKLGSYEDSLRDKPLQDTKRRQHTNDARELLKAVRPGLDLKEVETMRPLLALKGSIQAHVSRHEKLAVEERSAAKALREATDEVENTTKEHEQFDESRDPTLSTAAVNAAQRGGDLDAQAQAAKIRCDGMCEQCRVDLAALGLWQGSQDELEKAPLPNSKTVGLFESRFQDAAGLAHKCDQQLQELGERHSEITDKLADLARGTRVPTTDDLQVSRNHRDLGWSLVRRKCFDDEEVDTEIERYTQERSLPGVYEEAIHEADDLADRLRLDSDRVQQREILESELAKVDRKLQELLAQREEHSREQAELRKEWEQVWQPTGFTPRSPKEMDTWLSQAEKLRQNLEELRIREGDHAVLVQRRHDLRESLRQELDALGEDPEDVPADRLDILLERALVILEKLSQRLTRKRELEQALCESQATLTKVENASKDLASRRNQWQQDWGELIHDFDFLPDPSTTRVVATLEQLESLFKAVDKANEVSRRIYGIEKRISEFENEVDGFAEILGQPRGERPVVQYVVDLNDDLDKAREIETRLKSLQRQREELAGEETEQRGILRSTKGRFAELRCMARVDKNEELIEAGRNSDHLREIRARVAQTKQQLRNAGDSHSIEALRVQSQELDGIELNEEIARLTEKLDEVEQKHGEILRREAELNHELAAMSGAATAAESMEQAEQTLAQLREDVRTYLRLRAATLILMNQIESYRQANQAPVLRRASELFARLTLDSFKGLHDELDGNNRPILLGVRPDDREVTVDGMSDGTRDQLYLALRLATLEQHLETGEPIPFVVDDILVGFDDRRTVACLQVLGELASRTQVLLFTHHRRVAEIAGALGEDRGIFLHELATK